MSYANAAGDNVPEGREEKEIQKDKRIMSKLERIYNWHSECNEYYEDAFYELLKENDNVQEQLDWLVENLCIALGQKVDKKTDTQLLVNVCLALKTQVGGNTEVVQGKHDIAELQEAQKQLKEEVRVLKYQVANGEKHIERYKEENEELQEYAELCTKLQQDIENMVKDVNNAESDKVDELKSHLKAKSCVIAEVESVAEYRLQKAASRIEQLQSNLNEKSSMVTAVESLSENRLQKAASHIEKLQSKLKAKSTMVTKVASIAEYHLQQAASEIEELKSNLDKKNSLILNIESAAKARLEKAANQIAQLTQVSIEREMELEYIKKLLDSFQRQAMDKANVVAKNRVLKKELDAIKQQWKKVQRKEMLDCKLYC